VAASEAEKDLVYFTFFDAEFADALEACYSVLLSRGATVGKL